MNSSHLPTNASQTSRSNDRRRLSQSQQRPVVRCVLAKLDTVRWSVAVGFTLLLMVGCREQEEEPGTETVIREYASLSLLKESHDRELQDEVARLEAEDATILQLKGRLTPANTSSDLNAALEEALPNLEVVGHLKQRLATFNERELQQLDAVRTTELKAILAGYESQRDQLYKALRVVNRRCWVDYRMGLAANVDFVDRIEAACLLERMHAAVATYEGQSEQAFEAVERLFSYSSKLAEVWHIVPRIKAAEMRQRGYHAIQSFVDIPGCNQDDQVKLRNLTINELARWSPESHCWIGDRAIGLHTYEMVRDGQYLSLISDAEADELAEKRIQFATAKQVAENVDSDEAFYLRTMRRLIQSTERPYYQRSAAIAAAENDLNQMRESEAYPLVATQILLVNEVAVQRQLAEDRAMMEAWAVLLSQVTGERLPGATHDPCSGTPYHVDATNDAWVLQGLPAIAGLENPQIPKSGSSF